MVKGIVMNKAFLAFALVMAFFVVGILGSGISCAPSVDSNVAESYVDRSAEQLSQLQLIYPRYVHELKSLNNHLQAGRIDEKLFYVLDDLIDKTKYNLVVSFETLAAGGDASSSISAFEKCVEELKQYREALDEKDEKTLDKDDA